MRYDFHISRHLGPIILLLFIGASFALPAATPARAAPTITIGEILKDSVGNGESKDYKVRVQRNKQIMIGAVNLSLDALSATNDLKVTEVSCPGGGVSGNGTSDGGVVYCTPTGSDNYLDVEFKVENKKGGTIDYAVFVQLMEQASPNKILWSDQYITGTLALNKVALIQFPEQSNATPEATKAQLLLQYRGTNASALARIYSDTDSDPQGQALCAATLWWQNSGNPQPFPSSANQCTPLYTPNKLPNINYLVIINYGGGCINYRTYLVPVGSITQQDNLNASCTN